MEKLIELLNEYAHTYADHYDDTGEEIAITFLYHTDQCFTYRCDGEIKTLVDDVIISKRYEFIKRLIEKEKIDWSKFTFEYTGWQVIYKNCVPSIAAHKEVKTEYLLMFLAIQDNQIKVLISIIK